MSRESRTSGRVDKTAERASLYDKVHLRLISLVHDTMYSIFVDPHRALRAAGLQPGQTVLEVGCGPGFFTVAAAEEVGPEGLLYSIDINPAAVERVKRKIVNRGLTNVRVFRADATRTLLASSSVDVAFLFGVLHSLKDLDAVLLEMGRVLKAGGSLAIEKSHGTSVARLERFTRDGIFALSGEEAGVCRLSKTAGFELKVDEPRQEVR